MHEATCTASTLLVFVQALSPQQRALRTLQGYLRVIQGYTEVFVQSIVKGRAEYDHSEFGLYFTTCVHRAPTNAYAPFPRGSGTLPALRCARYERTRSHLTLRGCSPRG